MRYLPAGIVEKRVEQLYQRIALTPEHVRALRETLDHDIERVDQENAAVVAAQGERVKRLTDANGRTRPPIEPMP